MGRGRRRVVDGALEHIVANDDAVVIGRDFPVAVTRDEVEAVQEQNSTLGAVETEWTSCQ